MFFVRIRTLSVLLLVTQLLVATAGDALHRLLPRVCHGVRERTQPGHSCHFCVFLGKQRKGLSRPTSRVGRWEAQTQQHDAAECLLCRLLALRAGVIESGDPLGASPLPESIACVPVLRTDRVGCRVILIRGPPCRDWA